MEKQTVENKVKEIAEAMGAQVTLFNRMDAGQVIGVDAVVAWEE